MPDNVMPDEEQEAAIESVWDKIRQEGFARAEAEEEAVQDIQPPTVPPSPFRSKS